MQKQQRSRVGKIALAKKLVIVFIEKDYYTFTPAKLRLFFIAISKPLPPTLETPKMNARFRVQSLHSLFADAGCFYPRFKRRFISF